LTGDRLSHYRVLEQIGAGGMGVVYRARDEQLERDVAIKVLPPGTLVDDAARARFRREALSLARLNHPNVATVYEFGNHEGTDFLVTELIGGASIEERIAGGPLSAREAIDLGIQMARGLAAAHEAGIVHRDLKPPNLRLTPDGRLKILDFGLAQRMARASDLGLTKTITQSQEITGTLPYMAPEQLRGQPADARTDIWAAGTVLYELATGKRAFSDTQGPVLIDSILNRDPAPPRSLNPAMSPGFENVILKALQKDPANRYQTVRELDLDLERLTAGVKPLAEAAQSPAWMRWAGVAIALAAIGGAGYFALHRGKPAATEAPSAIATPKNRRSLAVLGFKNVSGKPDMAWFSTALSEMLATELAEGEQLRLIPGESIAQMKMSLALPEADSYSKETLQKIRENLGTDAVILGSYIPLGNGQIRLDLRLQDAIAGETLAAVSEKGSEKQLDELAAHAGEELRNRLGVAGLSERQVANVKATLPANPEAARLYSEGLAKLRSGDALVGRDLLLKAVAADPKHAASWASLSAAWSTLGYDNKALDAAKRAFDLSANLPTQERLRVEGQYYEANSQAEKAIASYQALFDAAPDNPDYGLKLANTQMFAGKAPDSLGTLNKLRALPPPQRDDLRIDLAEARAGHFLSDFQRERTVAAGLAEKAQKAGARFLVARARLAECSALRNMGDPKNAIPYCEEAKRIFDSAGERFGTANALNNIGNALYDLGDLPGAKKAYEEFEAINREIGNQGGIASALDNIASLVGDQGDLATANKLSLKAIAIYRETGDRINLSGALNNRAAGLVSAGDLLDSRPIFEESLAIARQIGSATGIATALVNLGDVRLALGDPTGARQAYDEALAGFEKNAEKSKVAYPLVGMGDVSSATGDLTAATQYYQRGLTVARETSEKHETAVALSGLGVVQMRQANFSGARTSFEEALALRKELGEVSAVGDSQLQLAQLTMEEGRPADAEKMLRGLVPAPKLPDFESSARAALAEALLAQGRTAEAQKEIALALRLLRKTGPVAVKLEVQLASARLLAASKSPTDIAAAQRELSSIIGEARKWDLVEPQLRARLTLAELDAKHGKGTASLEELRKEAQDKSYLVIAQKADRALRPGT